MRHSLVSLVCIVSLSFGFSACAAENTREPEIQKLAEVNYFAFGPIGAGQLVSTGENAFHELWSKDYAEAYFVELFQRGTAEGKCYALVGLRELSSEYFTKFADAFRKTAPQYVKVISAHFIGQERTSDLLAEIEAGRFAGFLKNKRA